MKKLKRRIRPMKPRLSPLIEVPNENNSNYNTNNANNYMSNSNNSAHDPYHNEDRLREIMAAPSIRGPVTFIGEGPMPLAIAAPRAIRPAAFKPSPGTGGARTKKRVKKLRSRRRN